MDQDPEEKPEEAQPPGGEQEPPPFDPDPRLVTYLEKGAKPDAETRFKARMERRARKGHQ